MPKEDLVQLLETIQDQVAASFSSVYTTLSNNDDFNKVLDQSSDMKAENLSTGDREVFDAMIDLHQKTKKLETFYKSFLEDEKK